MLQGIVRQRSAKLPPNAGKRRLYYLSAEFLIGKLLISDLINLGLYDEVKAQLEVAGHDLNKVEELEVEPSLGNGGLGRLAACFLDSIATLGLPGDGVGLNYHYGLFRQEFRDKQQRALPDGWLDRQAVLNDEGVSFNVVFGDFNVRSRLYSIDVTGYGRPTKNRLRLFDLEGVDDSLVPTDSIAPEHAAEEPGPDGVGDETDEQARGDAGPIGDQVGNRRGDDGGEQAHPQHAQGHERVLPAVGLLVVLDDGAAGQVPDGDEQSRRHDQGEHVGDGGQGVPLELQAGAAAGGGVSAHRGSSPR